MQTYDLNIKVLSPVHVGTGEQPGRKERWVEDGKVWLVDEEALFRRVSESPTLLHRFERFAVEERASLRRFLKNARIDPQSVALYGLKHFGANPYGYYLTHIKVPGRPPQPYIPGSSLKGAVRSALLRAMLIDDEAKQEEAARLIRMQMQGSAQPKWADDVLEEKFFGRGHDPPNWQNYDWMRLFSFSDTQPIRMRQLWATEVRILSIVGSGAAMHLEEKTFRRDRLIQLHPEVLRPGTRAKGRLTFNDELLSSLAEEALNFPQERGDVKLLLQECNRVAKEQIIQEWTFADRTKWREGKKFYGWMVDQLEKAIRHDACLLRLGWGSGYDDKTMTDLLDEETFDEVRDSYSLPVGLPGRRRGNGYLPKALSPKSRKVALDHKDRWLPLGWIQLSLAS